MKIEVGESLVSSYLNHVEGCRIIQTNWKTSSNWKVDEKLNNNMINSIELEIIFDETYNKYLTFTDVEKFLLPNYRFCGIKNYNHNLFEGINFFAEVLYLNKIFLDKKIKLSEKN